jgi:hypothetical protein
VTIFGEKEPRKELTDESSSEETTPRIQSLNKPAVVELLNEGEILKRFRRDGLGLGIARRDLIQDEANTADRRIGHARQFWRAKNLPMKREPTHL